MECMYKSIPEYNCTCPCALYSLYGRSRLSAPTALGSLRRRSCSSEVMAAAIFILMAFAPSVVFDKRSRTPLTGWAAAPIIPFPKPDTKPSTPEDFAPSRGFVNMPVTPLNRPFARAPPPSLIMSPKSSTPLLSSGTHWPRHLARRVSGHQAGHPPECVGFPQARHRGARCPMLYILGSSV